MYTYKPKTKQELQSIIKNEIGRQGKDGDLNFIDTSQITDTSDLFDGLDINDMVGLFFYRIINK
jgi:hypothetical protein